MSFRVFGVSFDVKFRGEGQVSFGSGHGRRSVLEGVAAFVTEPAMKRLPEKGVLDRQCGPFAAKWWLRTLARSCRLSVRGGWEWCGLSDYSVAGCCVVIS